MRRSDSFVELLQWFGLLAAGLAWTAQLVLGFGVSIAACSAGSGRWGVDVHTWVIVLTADSGQATLQEVASTDCHGGLPPDRRWRSDHRL